MEVKDKGVATLDDVAKLAGISRDTASVVLNGSRSNTRVSQATRDRILRAAAELAYQPNAVARSLRRRSTNIIGLFMGVGHTDVRNAFYATVSSGLYEGCHLHKKDMLVHSTFRGSSTEDIFADLADGKIDGLVLLASSDENLVERLAAAPLPVVAIADAVPSLPSVVVDDADGMRRVAAHLAAKGHRRVLYRTYAYAHASTERRKAAFLSAAAEHGMEVIVGETNDTGGRLGDAEKDILRLPAGERPTAVACCMDIYAHRTMLFCNKIGLKVPDDIAVTGFDGLEAEFGLAYHLTSVRAPWFDVGRTAVSVLDDQLRGKDVPQETVLPVELAVGDTT